MSLATERTLTFEETKDQTGLIIFYIPSKDGSTVLTIKNRDGSTSSEISLDAKHIDEAHILYMEATELLRSRAKIAQDRSIIRSDAAKLFALFRGEKVSFESATVPTSAPLAKGQFIPNPGKQLTIDVDGVTYERLPVRTRIITVRDKDLLPILEEYVKPYLKPGDLLFVSEKALTITQGRVVDMSDIKPAPLARLLARNVSNYYGSTDFHGFGHGTVLAMQLFLEEAGYARIIFAAVVSAITRPFGIRGLFYTICGKQAKSIDCPMSFLILDYAHSAKLAPHKPDAAAARFKQALGAETVILDANYRGAFSLGTSTRSISEAFIGKLFADNPLGQSDEMTPFCIVRKKI